MDDVSAGPDRPASGKASATLVAERRFADRRLAALARAIREHEGAIQRPRPNDRRLYKRLRDICSERIGQ